MQKKCLPILQIINKRWTLRFFLTLTHIPSGHFKSLQNECKYAESAESHLGWTQQEKPHTLLILQSKERIIDMLVFKITTLGVSYVMVIVVLLYYYVIKLISMNPTIFFTCFPSVLGFIGCILEANRIRESGSLHAKWPLSFSIQSHFFIFRCNFLWKPAARVNISSLITCGHFKINVCLPIKLPSKL